MGTGLLTNILRFKWEYFDQISFIDDVPIQTSMFRGFSIATFGYQRVPILNEDFFQFTNCSNTIVWEGIPEVVDVAQNLDPNWGDVSSAMDSNSFFFQQIQRSQWVLSGFNMDFHGDFEVNLTWLQTNPE